MRLTMDNVKRKSKRVQIILTQPQKQFLDEAAAAEGVSISALVRRIVTAYQHKLQERQPAQAARTLTATYTGDEDLTAFSALDGKDFV